MEILTKDPWHRFREKISNKNKILFVASPFITSKGANQIIETFEYHGSHGNKKFEFKLLLNCSKINIITSVEPIINPVNKLKEKFGQKLEIRSNSRLHAKLFLSDGIAMYGSSNLTSGGFFMNKELNTLTKSKKSRTILKEWFDDIWSTSDDLSISHLENLFNECKEERIKYHDWYANLRSPIYHLAGDSYKKLQEICQKDKLSKIDLDRILSERKSDPNEQNKNTQDKINFLKRLGFLRETLNNEEVEYIPIHNIRDILDPKELLYEILCEDNRIINEGLNKICEYDELGEECKIETLKGDFEDTEALTGARNWLKHLNYINESPTKPTIIAPTQLGRNARAKQ